MQSPAFLIAILCLGFSGLSALARQVENIAVIINEEIITKTDIESYQNRLKKGGLVDDALLQLTQVEQIKKDPKALLNHMIDERIIDSEVKRQGLEATIERVEQEIREIAGRNGVNRNDLKEALTRQGVKFSDYQNFIKISLGRQSLIEKEISSKIKISDEDISSYYFQEKGASGTQVFEYELAHILFLPKNGGETAAKERAEQTLARLKGSAAVSFDKVASQYSEDPGFTQGGALGTFSAGEMSKEMELAVRDLAQGEISGVVKTRSGYHILKVIRRTLVQDPAIAQEKSRIQNTLYSQAFKRQLRLWLDRKKDEAFIRVNSENS